MKVGEIDEIIGVLPKGKTPFHYYPGRYVFMLLDFITSENMKIAHLKKGRFSSLLEKPEVKRKMSSYGSGILPAASFEDWVEEPFTFLLTIGRWGPGKVRKSTDFDWYQTTRSENNLVLQLNFSNHHNVEYVRLVDPDDEGLYFEYSVHPICRNGLRTMAWSRLDIDLKSGEVLIEEIQSDWFRAAFERGLWWLGLPPWKCASEAQRKMMKRFHRYLETVLKPYREIWEEAMMASTIWFLREELGIRKLFYHTWSSGNYLKGIRASYAKPPLSLYKKLPEKFCFQKTDELPSFLNKESSRKWKEGLKKDIVEFYSVEL